MQGCYLAIILLCLLLQVRTKKVVYIGLDGTRRDALLRADVPNLKNLMQRGVFFDNVHSVLPTLSGPNWSTIFTSVCPSRHGVTSNLEGAIVTLRDENRFPHIFSYVKQQRKAVKTASISHIWMIKGMLRPEVVDFVKGPLPDAQVAVEFEKFLSGVSASEDMVAYLQFDDVDKAGHWSRDGFAVDGYGYLEALRVVDVEVGKVLALAEARSGEDWLLIVGSDHGGSGNFHWLNIPTHQDVFLIITSLSNGTFPTFSFLDSQGVVGESNSQIFGQVAMNYFMLEFMGISAALGDFDAPGNLCQEYIIFGSPPTTVIFVVSACCLIVVTVLLVLCCVVCILRSRQLERKSTKSKAKV